MHGYCPLLISLSLAARTHLESALQHGEHLRIQSDCLHGLALILSIALSELNNEAGAHFVCLLVEDDVFVGTDLCIGQGEGLVGLLLICQLEEVNEATLCVKCEW